MCTTYFLPPIHKNAIIDVLSVLAACKTRVLAFFAAANPEKVPYTQSGWIGGKGVELHFN